MPGPGAPSASGAAAASPPRRAQSRCPSRQARPRRRHGGRTGARALGHCVFRACPAATTGLTCPGIGAYATWGSSPASVREGLLRAGARRSSPRRRRSRFLLALSISLFLLFASILGAEPAALGGRLGGLSFVFARVSCFYYV